MDETAKLRRRRRWLNLLRLLVGVTLVLALLYWLDHTPTELLERVEFHGGHALLAFAGSLAAILTTTLRWKLIAESLGGTRLRFSVYFYALALTRFLGQFTSTIGMDLIGRGVALRSGGSERALGHATTQIVLERTLDLALPIGLLGWAYLVQQRELDPLTSLLAFFALFFALAVPLLAPSFRVGLAVYLAMRRLFRRPPIGAPVEARVGLADAAKIAALSITRFIAVVVQFLGIAWATGIDIEWVGMFMATPVAQLASALGFTPGALGVAEVGWAGGFEWIGQDAAATAIFVVAQRLAVTTFMGLLSLIGYPFRRQPESKPTAST